ncbi:hypothetical protein EHQ12_02375 [Leptospira gomenensis]|uniref:Galactose oxidase n=1 Tax=Leptospira gomenensis TaxID=2484974 RepID=A0A5F1YM24_9LEPT|nr:hypothetical protein [Leptospira gomenensis]TGK33720.1 hypothetical protein EHQ17_10470 [Leptospira gomenensis]TGK41963.1 hypothetical protein EHQ07_15110 [Leptospira gomenensis]TGK44215.1 hypothetical protein EHQ12_02375 [Leptospira gomenensis]TGK58003.1 hypothetical protein EHQ13_14660 [Leptospira gomenensis]
MKKIVFVFLFSSFCSCAQADKFSLDSSNPLAILGQFGWSLARVPDGVPIEGTQFVAAGQNCGLWTSETGTEWSFRNSSFPNCDWDGGGGRINGVVYGGNKTWVAVGFANPDQACGLWYSTDDALTWTQATCDDNSSGNHYFELTAVAYGNGYFWAGGEKEGDTTSHPFYGLRSSDGIHWNYFPIETSGDYSIPDAVSSIAYDSVHSFVYFGFNDSIVGKISRFNIASDVWTPEFHSSLSVNIAGTKKSPFALKSGSMVVFGDDANGIGIVNFLNDPSGAWSGQKYAGITGKIASIAEGNGTLIALGDACTIDSTSDVVAASTWSHAGGVPVGVSGCSAIDWSASAYNEALGLFVIGGRSLNGSSTKLGISSTGDFSSWQLIAAPENASLGQAIFTIAAKKN